MISFGKRCKHDWFEFDINTKTFICKDDRWGSGLTAKACLKCGEMRLTWESLKRLRGERD